MTTVINGVETKKEVIITKVSDASGDYIIPEEVDGCVVSGIADGAFQDCDKLTSVTIPKSVSRIGGGAFWKCNSLTSFYVAKGNSRYKVIDGLLIEDDDTLVAIPGNLENLQIPNFVTRIGNHVNIVEGNLKSVTIPNGVTKIGECAFIGSGLTSVEIPSSVKRICDSAFAFCFKMTSVTIANGVEFIDKNAFYECSSLTSITIPKSVKEIGESAFHNCFSLNRVTFAGVGENISPSAFDDNIVIHTKGHCKQKNELSMNKTLTDLTDASSSDVATAFIAWLATATTRGKRMVDANRRKYAMHLTAEYVSRLHTDLYNGTYNLFDLRGLQEVCRVLEVLRSTDAFRATQRANGGNGAFQASFVKLESFWEYMEHGGIVDAEELNSARQIWEQLCNGD